MDECEDEHQEKRKKKDKEKKGQFMKFYTNIFLDKKPKKGTLDMFFSGNSSKTVKDDVSFFAESDYNVCLKSKLKKTMVEFTG